MKTAWLAVLLGVLLQGQSSVAEKKVHPSTDLTCQTIPRNFLVNPSFETGDISPWVKFDSEIGSLPLVISDSSDDGKFVMKIGPAGGYWVAQQTVTELTIGTKYTLSFDYKPTTSGKFDLFIEENGNLLASVASVYKPGAYWKTISGSFKATETSHRVAILIWSEGGTLEIDNAKLIGPEKTQVCSTSTISSTVDVTPTSSASPSSIAPSSTPADFISSSVVPTSTPLGLSSTPLVSPSTILSSQIIPSSSPIPFSSIPISVPSSESLSVTPSGLSSSAVPSSEVPSSAVSSSAVASSMPYLISSQPLSSRPISKTPSPVLPLATPSSAPLESSTALSSPSSSVPQSSSPSSTVPLPSFTTSTILSTHTATITACPSMVPDCPASEKSTFVTTETIVVSTTVCPITETSKLTAPQPTATGTQDNGVPPVASTTSTVFSTRTATITACPSSVVDCPVRQKSTYVTTETILVSTTVCPVAASEVTSTAGVDSNGEVSTSTVFTTRTSTVTACPSTITNCPASAKSTIVTTETLVASTVLVTIEAKPTATGALTSLPAAVTSGGSGSSSGSYGSSNSAGSASSGSNVSGVAGIQAGAPSSATTFHRASSSPASVIVSSVRPSSTPSSASQKTSAASGTVTASGLAFTGSGFSALKMIPVYDMLLLLVASMFFLS